MPQPSRNVDPVAIERVPVEDDWRVVKKTKSRRERFGNIDQVPCQRYPCFRRGVECVIKDAVFVSPAELEKEIVANTYNTQFDNQTFHLKFYYLVKNATERLFQKGRTIL